MDCICVNLIQPIIIIKHVETGGVAFVSTQHDMFIKYVIRVMLCQPVSTCCVGV